MSKQPSSDDLGKLDPNAIRLNLMIASLYLFAFELLRVAIVGGVKSHFVPSREYSQDEIDEMKDFDAKMEELGRPENEVRSSSVYQAYMTQLKDFEDAVGESLDTRENHLLIPCAKWLEHNKAINSEDVKSISRIRDHRNSVAHEIPNFLFLAGHDVDVELVNQTKEILRKVNLFWFRMHIMLDPATLEEIDTAQIPDDEVFSSQDAFMKLASDAVVDYAKQFGSDSEELVN